MTPREFQVAAGVSRETMERLEAYAAVLCAWQPKLNLVGPATLPELWQRHFLDSSQLVPLLPPQDPIMDIGSGAGFPGLVIAIVTARPVTLVESDARKSAFLREAIRVSGATAAVQNRRIETLPHGCAAILTARALAPLTKLCGYAQRLLAPDGQAFFLKGQRWEEELTEARQHWTMQLTAIPSRTNPSSIILRVERPSHAGQPPT